MIEDSLSRILFMSGCIFILLGYRINDYSHLVSDKKIMFRKRPFFMIIDSNTNRIMHSTFLLQITGYLCILSGVLIYALEADISLNSKNGLIEELKLVFIYGTIIVLVISVGFMLVLEYKARKK